MTFISETEEFPKKIRVLELHINQLFYAMTPPMRQIYDEAAHIFMMLHKYENVVTSETYYWLKKKHMKTLFCIVMGHRVNVAYLQIDVQIFTSQFFWRSWITMKGITWSQLADAAEQRTYNHSHKCSKHTGRCPTSCYV